MDLGLVDTGTAAFAEVVLHLEQAIRNRQPLILRNLVSHWPCVNGGEDGSRTWRGPGGAQRRVSGRFKTTVRSQLALISVIVVSRLVHLAGPAQVQVMRSKGGHFYGDLSRHEPASCTLAWLLSEEGGIGSPPSTSLYLAQQTILGRSSAQQEPLADEGLVPLLEDLTVPPELLSALGTTVGDPSLSSFQSAFAASPLTELNLWLSLHGSRSSLHYDEYHNLVSKAIRISPTIQEMPRIDPPSLSPSLRSCASSGAGNGCRCFPRTLAPTSTRCPSRGSPPTTAVSTLRRPTS